MENKESYQEDYMTIEMDKKTFLYYGCVYRYHPKPSGTDRWILSKTTAQGFEKPREVGIFMNERFPHLKQFDIEALSNEGVRDTLPEIPKGAEITLMLFNELSYDPAPKRCFPKIEVRVNGKVLPVTLTHKQLWYLKDSGDIVIDCSTDDPELSCSYYHYDVKNDICRSC